MELSTEKYNRITFEIHKKWWKRQKWHFRIVAANKKILASSEGYFNKADCESAINLIKKQAQTAPINFKEDAK